VWQENGATARFCHCYPLGLKRTINRMTALVIILLALAVLAVLALRYGVDTRDGRDWQPRSR
jgi:predicted membrane chloride channel (bestrophin family)